MKTPRYDFLAAVLIVWVGVSTANSQTVEWARQLGTESFDLGSDVSVDGIGNVFISGFSSLGLDDTNPDARGAFVSKFDTEGNLDWTRHLETRITLGAYYGISADEQGNVYISGTNSTGQRGEFHSFLSKFDTDGNLNWTRTIENAARGSGDSGFFSTGRANVFADGRGSVYLSGSTLGAHGGANAGGADVFVSKFDEEGNTDWIQQLGSTADDFSFGISADERGNVFLSGITKGDLDGPNMGGTDAFVSKLDEDGNLDWTRQLGTATTDFSYGASADGSGNVFISGYTLGNLDGDHMDDLGKAAAFVSKYNEEGLLDWTKQFGLAPGDGSFSVSADRMGSVFVSGITARGQDTFVSKLDTDGNLVWTSQLDFSGSDESHGVSVDGLGNVYISGFTNGSVDGPNAGRLDAFLVKLNDETFVPEPSSLLLVLSAMTVFAGRCRVD